MATPRKQNLEPEKPNLSEILYASTVGFIRAKASKERWFSDGHLAYWFPIGLTTSTLSYFTYDWFNGSESEVLDHYVYGTTKKHEEAYGEKGTEKLFAKYAKNIELEREKKIDLNSLTNNTAIQKMLTEFQNKHNKITIGQSNKSLLDQAIQEKENIIILMNRYINIPPETTKTIEKKLNEAIIQIADETQATNARFEFFLRVWDNAATNDFLMNQLYDKTKEAMKNINKNIDESKNTIKFLETFTRLSANDNNSNGIELVNSSSEQNEEQNELDTEIKKLKQLEKEKSKEIYKAIKEDFHTFTSIKTPSGNHIILCTRPDEKAPKIHHKIYKVQQTTFNWMFGAGRSYQTQLREDWILLGLKIKADGIEKPTINIDPKYTHDEEKSLGEALRIYEGLHRAGYSDEDITIKMYVTDRTFNPNEPQSDKNMPYKKIEFSAKELKGRCEEADQLKFNKRLVNKYNNIMNASVKPYNETIQEVSKLKQELQEAKKLAEAKQEDAARAEIKTTETAATAASGESTRAPDSL